jgi:hypothetical protein
MFFSPARTQSCRDAVAGRLTRDACSQTHDQAEAGTFVGKMRDGHQQDQHELSIHYGQLNAGGQIHLTGQQIELGAIHLNGKQGTQFHTSQLTLTGETGSRYHNRDDWDKDRGYEAVKGEGSYHENLHLTRIGGSGDIRISEGAQIRINLDSQQAGAQAGQAASAEQLRNLASQLASEPGLGYLGQLAQRPDIDWQGIATAHRDWDYKGQGLTQEGAIVLTAVVAILTYGSGAELVGAAADAAVTTAVANAGFTALATTTAVSLANNGGDLGKTLGDLGSSDTVKNVVSAMLTAGLTQGFSQYLQGQQLLVSDLGRASLSERFAHYATRAAVGAGVQSAVFGQPLAETAKTALINSVAQSLTSEIGDWGKGSETLVAKTLAHAAVQCAAASAQGKDCGSAALGAATAEVLSPYLDNLDDRQRQTGIDQTKGSSIAGIVATLAASIAGRDPGAANHAAQMVDTFNRQLHPDEAKIIAANAKKYADKREISLEQAIAELTQQAEQNFDSAWDARLGSDNPAALAFLKEIGLGKTMVDAMTGQSYQLFTADAAQRDNHAMFAQYSKSDPLVKAELDLAMNKAYLPKGAQVIAGVNGSNPGTFSGSDLALNDAARDYGDMRSQPAVVQQTVLAELRATRLDIAQQEAVLLEQLKALPLTPENRDRRADLQSQIDRLETRDFFLLKASQAQILDMGSAGLLNPLKQAETVDGFGDALGGARLSGKGVSSASINGRINMLKGAVEEAKAAVAAEKAIVQVKVENGVNADAHFAGEVPIRPRDGVVEPGTAQIDTPIAKHLIDAEIKLNKQGQPTSVSGGHNMDNFNQALQVNGGQVIGAPKEVASGIYQVEYRLPGTRQGEIEIKTVYDPAKYSDAQMASMANEAVGRAIYQWNASGGVSTKEFVTVAGIRFEVPFNKYKGQVYVPTAYPSAK